MPKVPIDPMCAKKVTQDQKSKFSGFFIFLENGKFFLNIAQTNIAEHTIINKKGPYTFFLRITIPKIFPF